MQTMKVYRQAIKSLPLLQELEANGQLPYTQEVGKGFKCSITSQKRIAHIMAKNISANDNVIETIQWLEDGGYMVDYIGICVRVALSGNVKLLEELYKSKKYLCILYLLKFSNKTPFPASTMKWIRDIIYIEYGVEISDLVDNMTDNYQYTRYGGIEQVR